MTIAQRFAQIFGAVYLLVGILGFVPPLLAVLSLIAALAFLIERRGDRRGR